MKFWRKKSLDFKGLRKLQKLFPDNLALVYLLYRQSLKSKSADYHRCIDLLEALKDLVSRHISVEGRYVEDGYAKQQLLEIFRYDDSEANYLENFFFGKSVIYKEYLVHQFVIQMDFSDK